MANVPRTIDVRALSPRLVVLATDDLVDMGQDDPVDVVTATPDLSESDRRQVCRGNALGLLGMP
jgi:hypothetical protein